MVVRRTSGAIGESNRWLRLNGHEPLPLVRTGVSLEDGVRVERDDDQVTAPAKKHASKKEAREP